MTDFFSLQMSMQNINLAVGYHNISNFHHLNLAMTDSLTDAIYNVPAPFQGLDGFREAIAAKLQIANGITGITADNVLVTQGATQALFMIAEEFLAEGDEVLLPLPAWGYFRNLLRTKKVNLKELMTTPARQYKITATELAENLTTDTKMLILTQPGNPGGGIYTHAEWTEIAEVLEQYPDLIILADEVYELLIFAENVPFYPASFFPSFNQRVITVNGFSKSYGLTSWRIAYLYTHNPGWIERLTERQKLMTYGLPVATQRIAWTALQKEKLYAVIWQQHAAPRRRQLYDFFARQEHCEVYLPDGGYFIFVDLRKFCAVAGFTRSVQLPFYLIENYNLHIADGDIFGLPFHYRINFVQSEAVLTDAVKRLEAAFEKLLEGRN